MKRNAFLVCIFLCTAPFTHAGFEIEKQKLKLSLEYENFVDPVGNEIITPGPKASYLMKGKARLGKAVWTVDFQTGLKSFFDRDFEPGKLPAVIFSNRINTAVQAPVGRFYFGGSFYFWNKMLGGVSDTDPFIDVFGGLGFREVTGSVQAGFIPAPQWDLQVSIQASDLNFTDFPLSDSKWDGISGRVSRRIKSVRVNAEYRNRNITYNRPVLLLDGPRPGPVIFPAEFGNDIVQQEDRFQELGASIEIFHGFYFLGGYAFQDNESNNPGFTYQNHRFQFVIGTELSSSLHFQAFGSVQSYDFLQPDSSLQFPLLLGENEYSTMAASLIKTLGESTELEFGFQRIVNHSSFESLDVSKFNLFAAYNYRF